MVQSLPVNVAAAALVDLLDASEVGAVNIVRLGEIGGEKKAERELAISNPFPGDIVASSQLLGVRSDVTCAFQRVSGSVSPPREPRHGPAPSQQRVRAGRRVAMAELRQQLLRFGGPFQELPLLPFPRWMAKAKAEA